MATWVKADGREIEVNDTEASIKAAEAAGWKRKRGPKKKKAE